MATLALGAVGSAIGGAFGGAILGFSGAAIGGFIESTIGSVVDNWIVSSPAPAQRIEGARLDSLHITSSTEGAVIPRPYGRMRIGGNIMWATDFRTPVAGDYVLSTTGAGGAATGVLAGAAGRIDLFPFIPRDGHSLGDPVTNPRCGDFVETCIRMSLPDGPLIGALGTNPYWARNWLLFGQDTKPVTGAVLVFERGSGGHVGFAVGQDDTHLIVLGGNQSDAVTIAHIAKSRLLGARWSRRALSKRPTLNR